jgi:tRNA (guanine37-N1)-methyltransferase
MRLDVYSIFPDMLRNPLQEGLLGKAINKGILGVSIHDIRDYASDKHRQVDDTPFGGGPGMIMKPEPVFKAVTTTLGYSMEELDKLKKDVEVILLSPRGRRLDQKMVNKMAQRPHLAIICGRYEGVDERVREHLCTETISIGDYVISGGEFAALVLIEAVARLIPGVIGNRESLGDESFSRGLLEYPQYTRPAEYHGWKVPEVILSGNHGEIEKWREKKAREWTMEIRPDLSGLADREGDGV